MNTTRWLCALAVLGVCSSYSHANITTFSVVRACGGGGGSFLQETEQYPEQRQEIMKRYPLAGIEVPTHDSLRQMTVTTAIAVPMDTDLPRA